MIGAAESPCRYCGRRDRLADGQALAGRQSQVHAAPTSALAERLRALMATATPGPWKAGIGMVDDADCIFVNHATVTDAVSILWVADWATYSDLELILAMHEALPAILAALEAPPLAGGQVRPRAEWGDDDGDVLWWIFPITEPPYVGSPLCENWPDYHTHWQRIALPAPPAKEAPHG